MKKYVLPLYIVQVFGLGALLNSCKEVSQNSDSSSLSTAPRTSASSPALGVTSVRVLPKFDKTVCLAPNPDVPGPYPVHKPETSTKKIESTHFVGRWNASDNVTNSDAEIILGLTGLEKIRQLFITKVGFDPPYKGYTEKYKISVNLSDQGYATGSGSGDHDPEMWVNQEAFADSSTLAHELAHTFQFSSRGMRDSKFVGWAWESHANWMAHQYNLNDISCGGEVLDNPHLHYGDSTNRYCNWLFWEYLKDQSCYQVVNDIWIKAKKPEDPDHINEDPFKILARNMKWTQGDLNTIFANWALHNATLDYKNGATYLKDFGPMDDVSDPVKMRRITRLKKIQTKVFAVPEYWAPQRWGYNLVKLYPTRGATNIILDFKGIVQARAAASKFGDFANQPTVLPAPNSDWRWGVVAMDAKGARRYSPISGGREGQIKFPLLPGDKKVWLVVMGTPTLNHQIEWDQAYYTIYRYPWMIRIDGALPEGSQPGSPRFSVSGALHPNGGGWVATGANVAKTAFVGIDAVVLGGEVSDFARIEDRAIIVDGKISGRAVVGGLAIVNDPAAVVTGSAVLKTSISYLGPYVLSGTAQVHGDSLIDTSIKKGIYYTPVAPDTILDPLFGSTRTKPSLEVTAKPVYTWP